MGRNAEVPDNPFISLKDWNELMYRTVMHEDFKSKFLGEWQNDAVYSQEEISKMLERGEISDIRAEEMLRMRYTVNRKGEKIIEDKERW